MKGPEIAPLTEEHLDGAAEVLAARHRRHRAAEPLLSPAYEDAAACRELIATAYAADDASGAVALDGSRVVGYLLGAPKNDSWGVNTWVESAGHAVEVPEVARTLYAVAATRWLEEGRTAHYVLLPSHDAELVHTWFRLAFGWQHTHAVREPAEAGPVREGLTVRQPRRDEIPVLARLDMVLTDHQHLSPCFSGGPLDVYEERVADWEEDFDNPKYWNVVVEHDGSLVGSAVGCSLDVSSSHAGPAAPEHAGFLGFAAVFPGARGLGVGRALGEAVSAWALAEGYSSLVTDWRETNLLSSRAWRGLGYRDTFTRLHRLVGH
ncbi:GNAT family N-acetyltransferase [Nocardioides islandensis]|uniref:GNAT family N-acetyltransferase n=1 Tax=Nocardioides islandensis TaxID=433663 RepID=UPI002B26E21D|nr:GNAT family N-acetyltransferase [Nocardioides islandensis]